MPSSREARYPAIPPDALLAPVLAVIMGDREPRPPGHRVVLHGGAARHPQTGYVADSYRVKRHRAGGIDRPQPLPAGMIGSGTVACFAARGWGL